MYVILLLSVVHLFVSVQVWYILRIILVNRAPGQARQWTLVSWAMKPPGKLRGITRTAIVPSTTQRGLSISTALVSRVYFHCSHLRSNTTWLAACTDMCDIDDILSFFSSKRPAMSGFVLRDSPELYGQFSVRKMVLLSLLIHSPGHLSSFSSLSTLNYLVLHNTSLTGETDPLPPFDHNSLEIPASALLPAGSISDLAGLIQLTKLIVRDTALGGQ